MGFRYKKGLAITAPIALAIGASFLFSSVSQLKDPESEFAEIRTTLATIQDQIDAALKINGRPGLGPQTVEADENYQAAKRYFESEEYPATIRMLNSYLNNTQVPEFDRYKTAQYMLGKSYEHLGRKDFAIRAYLRYIAAFLTAETKDHKEFLDVLRRTVALSIDADEYSEEAGSLIASLTSLDLPGDVKSIVNVIAAKSALKNRKTNVAGQLLEDTLKNTGDSTLKAKAYYIKALIAISQKKYNDAEDLLAQATQKDVDEETKDLARLALARIATKRGKPNTALKYYSLVDEKSPSFKDALFESIYTSIDLGEESQARAKALLYIARYKDSAEAIQLRMILAYLDLKSGDYGAAKVSLTNAEQRVQDVDQYLYKNLMYKTNVTATELNTLSSLTAGHIDDVPSVKKAMKAFSSLAMMQRYLADIDGEIRSIVLATSNSALATVNPTWVNRSEQLAQLGDQLLGIGHRMIATETYLYENQFDALSKQKLTASENRRVKLLGKNITMKRNNINWKSYRDYLGVHVAIGESSKLLASTQADLAAIKLAKETGKAAINENQMKELNRKIQQLQTNHQELVRKASLEKIKKAGLQGPHHGARLFLSQYVEALEEESDLIETARESQASTAGKLLASDAKEYWKQWRFAVGRVLEGFTALDKEVTTTLTESADKLDALSERQADLLNRLYAITNIVETTLGANLHGIINQYSVALNKKSARNKKWNADIDWLEYQSKQEDESKLTEKYHLEEQILNENLRDIKQGLIW